MKLYLLALLPIATLTAGFTVSAAQQGHGSVRMQGSIIDTPCAIEAGSRDQSIDLSVIPVSQIVRDGQGPSKPFTIRLINCTLVPSRPYKSDWSSFRVTFDGSVTDQDLFSVTGDASGVGLQITDVSGNVAIPGQAMAIGLIEPGNMSLDYILRLMPDHHTLRPGTYRSVIRFKMDYY